MPSTAPYDVVADSLAIGRTLDLFAGTPDERPSIAALAKGAVKPDPDAPSNPLKADPLHRPAKRGDVVLACLPSKIYFERRAIDPDAVARWEIGFVEEVDEDGFVVKMRTKNLDGSPVSLPVDRKSPFARYICPKERVDVEALAAALPLTVAEDNADRARDRLRAFLHSGDPAYAPATPNQNEA